MQRSPAEYDDPLTPNREPVQTPPLVAGTPTASLLKSGAIVEGRLEVQSLIASGGFGSVYKVRHIVMNKTLALKTLHPVVKSDKTIHRLKRESVAIAKLDHPNIVHAMDFGLIDGTIPYIVMEYVEGRTLAESLKGPPLSVDAALKLFIPLCEALAYAHDQGVIHRDIKPGNIMLSPDEKDSSSVIPKIVDFGIAKLTFGEDAGLTLTQTGDIFGTPLYMSPEQCAGTSVDHRSDIYSLGCILFETLTGAPPISGNTPLETMMRHASGEVPSLKEASLGKEFPPALEVTVARMLAKDVRQRYQSCYEVANDLRLILKGDAASVRAPAAIGSAQTNSGPMRKIDWFAVTVAGILIFGIGIISGIVIGRSLLYTGAAPVVHEQSSGLNSSKASDDSGAAPAPAFFHTDGQPNVFHFPTEDCLGQLEWVKNSKWCKADARGPVTIEPKNALLEFTPYGGLMDAPHYWGCFRPTDLGGLHLTRRGQLDFEHQIDNADAAVVAAWQQRNLRILELNAYSLSQQAFRLIGDMRGLTSLIFHKVSLADVHHAQGIRPLSPMEIAALPNLHQLDTLVLSDVDASPSLLPLLQALRAGHLRRLAIYNVPISEQDLNAIAEISSLETIEILTDKPCEKQLKAYSRLPKLRKLCMLAQEEPVSVYKFPKLEQLYLVDPRNKVKGLGAAFKKHIIPSATFNWTTDLKIDAEYPSYWFGQLD